LSLSLRLTFIIVALPSLFLVLFGVQIIHFWVGPEITPSFLLLAGMGIWTLMQTLATTIAMFLCGANILRLQVISASLMAVSALIVKILLTQSIGLPGIIWGTIIAYALFTFIPYMVYLPKLFAGLALRHGGGAPRPYPPR
jgi:hypothetical protein